MGGPAPRSKRHYTSSLTAKTVPRLLALSAAHKAATYPLETSHHECPAISGFARAHP